MGFVRVAIQLANPSDPTRVASLEVLVDTGVLLTFLPAEFLTRLGIEPFERSTFQLADGSRIEREVGEARFLYNGKQGVSKVAFGKPSDATVIGVLALETLGLEVDPVHQKLRPTIALFY